MFPFKKRHDGGSSEEGVLLPAVFLRCIYKALTWHDKKFPLIPKTFISEIPPNFED